MTATRYNLFRCRSCGWSGIAGRTRQRCPRCRHGSVWPGPQPALVVLRRNMPPPPGSRDAEIARLQGIIASLAERCAVQAECLERAAEKKEIPCKSR